MVLICGSQVLSMSSGPMRSVAANFAEIPRRHYGTLDRGPRSTSRSPLRRCGMRLSRTYSALLLSNKIIFIGFTVSCQQLHRQRCSFSNTANWITAMKGGVNQSADRSLCDRSNIVGLNHDSNYRPFTTDYHAQGDRVQIQHQRGRVAPEGVFC